MLNSLGVNIFICTTKEKYYNYFQKVFKGLDQSGITKLYVRKEKNITTFSKNFANYLAK